MNDWNPATSQMNQQCKVCGEPAAGFHFGAFTCEGCKSFFGRSYNNLSSISECKNGGQCVINKKNRTSCKACRLRKCLVVGMSKSGSRYGRRSNWFKIHCLLQEQANSANNNNNNNNELRMYETSKSPSQLSSPNTARLMQQQFASLTSSRKHEDCEREYKTSSSPSISSPESHNSDSSVEISDARLGLLNGHLAALRNQTTKGNQICDPKDFFIPLPFLPPAALMQSSPFAAAAAAAMAAQHAQKFLFPNSPNPYLGLYPTTVAPTTQPKAETAEEICSKRFYLDAILQSQRTTLSSPTASIVMVKPEIKEKFHIPTPVVIDQDNPMDLSMKSRASVSPMDSDNNDDDDDDSQSDDLLNSIEEKSSIKREESDAEHNEFISTHSKETAGILKGRSTPLDLTTRLETAA